MDQQEQYSQFLTRISPESMAKFLYHHLRAKQIEAAPFSRSKYISRSRLSITVRVSDHIWRGEQPFDGADIVVLPNQQGILLDGEMLPIPKRLKSHISIIRAAMSALKHKYAEYYHIPKYKPKPKK